MDILGSIMKNMVKPPAMDEKERKFRQQQKEVQKKDQEEKERRVKIFREKVDKKMEAFAADEAQTRLVFEPMDKLCRAILHDISETAGFLAHSFGTDEVDRYVIVFKPDGVPCEAEMSALRRGDEYCPRTRVEGQDDEQENNEEEDDQPRIKSRRGKNSGGPAPEYLQKYEKHLGGLGVAKEAAQSTKTSNRTYGNVSSESKRDKRTIEETLADIKARKKQKTEEDKS